MVETKPPQAARAAGPTRRRTVIYPPVLDWTFLRQRPQQLMSQFARHGWRVFYCQITRRPGAAMEEVEPGLWLVHDLERFIQDVVPGLDPLVCCSSPELVSTLSQYRPARVVFDYLDDFPEHRRYLPAMFAVADLVVVTAIRLERIAKRARKRVVMVPNACDFEVESQGGPGPPDIAGLPRPRVGFIGAWGRWCSNEILLASAGAVPNGSVVVLGPAFGREIPTAPNIHALGTKLYCELPAYMAGFDVGLLPFDDSDISKAANPIKLWQYLAAGLPVIATETPETSRLSPRIWLAKSPEEFGLLVGLALASDSPAARSGRQRFASMNTWQHRFRDIEAALAGA